jgi:rRNA small subunit aminocarboxypropyltransferase
MKPLVYMLRQDDPSKCTAAKLVKFRIAEPARRISKKTIVLNPFSSEPVTRRDSQIADYVCAIDCSWEKADDVLKQKRLVSHGIGRRLPALLAANPVNYAKLGKLSSAEALAGALYILGSDSLAAQILDKFKWGHTFSELNKDLIQDYSAADTVEQVLQIEREYFPQLS